MSLGFLEFKEIVRSFGGVWASGDVRFTRFRDGFSASYKPEWPEHCKEDCAYTYNFEKDTWRYISPEEYDKEYHELGLVLEAATTRSNQTVVAAQREAPEHFLA